MFGTLRNAWKVPDIRKKMLYTVLMLLVYRLGAHIPIPGVDNNYIASHVTSSTLGQFLDLFSGGLAQFSLFALGITPYITGQIIMQLLTMAIPALERMQKEGPEGRKRIASITRYVGVILGLVQSISILIALGPNAILNDGTGFLNTVMIICLMTAGTALIMWIGEKITDNGVGNGVSMLIYVSIISRIPTLTINLFKNTGTQSATSWINVLIFLLLAVGIIVGITFIYLGERRIPVQYAKRVVGRKIYGGQSTHIPMKINQSGVLPLIFAITLLQFPGMIMQFVNDTAAKASYESVMGSNKPLYIVIYALLIFFFTFFYAQVSFNTDDVAKNIQQNGGFIPGIRAGKPTADYLKKILSKITLFGAVFLALIAAIPSWINALIGFSSTLGATSILIMVNVALDTNNQLEAHMMMRHYKGFLK